MPISPEYLPTELHYILPLAERHGSDARISSFSRRLGRHVPYGETLKKDAIESLRKLYIEISAKGHGPLINRWHDGKPDTCPSETSWPVFGLLCLFDQLARLGIAPFKDGVVRTMEKIELLDWSKLPACLNYLAGPAEVWGVYQFEGRIIDFLRSEMTGEERAELQALNKRYVQDSEAINRWLAEHDMTKHPEARLVYFTGQLLGIGVDMELL